MTGHKFCAAILVLLAAFHAEGAVKLDKDLRRETRNLLLQSDLKSYAPYVGGGFIEALPGNWKFITDAYYDKAEWSDALTHTGADIAGYTIAPVIVDGLLASSESQFAILLKEAEAGVFCWSAGKEFFSYSTGGITHSEFTGRLKSLSSDYVKNIPVKILGFLASRAGCSFISPVVIIAGAFAVQRVEEWHEFQRWKNTVYVDDIRAILGDDLMRDFTLANPETRFNMADPEKRPSLANSERRKSIAQP
ncbi:MAG: hypothetical protein IJR63_01605 [Synergistaceae bacterium]|nr:hypothetical protein [Synergistaceae bacterium]